jgi:hypothetical protein
MKDRELSTQAKKAYRDVRFEGAWYDVDGEKVELFLRRVMAAALGIKTKRLNELTVMGVIPHPIFKTPRFRGDDKEPFWYRYYTGVQCYNMNMLALEKYKMRVRQPYLADFGKDANTLFYVKRPISALEARYFNG